MVLNPALAKVLQERYGEVRITHEGDERIERRTRNGPVVIQTGESYNVCCPFCEEERFRLSVSHMWLTRRHSLTKERRFDLINCYNEGCQDVWKPDFYEPILKDVEAKMLVGNLEELDLNFRNTRTAPKFRGDIRMPFGCKPLKELPRDHRAIKFLIDKYPGMMVNPRAVDYLSDVYGVCFTAYFDDIYPQAQYRIIFPVYDGNKVVGWQGRRVDGSNDKRWYLPPGFKKMFYNGHNVSPVEIPIINEGIVNAIASGPKGIAVFGKHINMLQAQEMGEKWKAAIIATDPDTFTPDNRKGGKGRVYAKEMQELLSTFIPSVRMLPWPDDIMELAKRSNNSEDVHVPDAAELGFAAMRKLIDKVS